MIGLTYLINFFSKVDHMCVEVVKSDPNVLLLLIKDSDSIKEVQCKC